MKEISLVQVFLWTLFFSVLLTANANMDDLLLWGTYKPYLLSAITQKSINPITVGFAYSEYLPLKDSEEVFKQKLRHRMRRNSTAKYSHHNGFDFSVQQIEDPDLCINYNISFVKEIDFETKRQKWYYLIEGVRSFECLLREMIIQADNSDPHKNLLEIFSYISLQNLDPEKLEDTEIRVLEKDHNRFVLAVPSPSENVAKGYFRISIENNLLESHKDYFKKTTGCLSTRADKYSNWMVEDIIYDHISDDVLDEITFLDPWKCQPNSITSNGTFFLAHTKAYPRFTILISYDSHEVPEEKDMSYITNLIDQKKQTFEEECSKVFKLSNINRFMFDKAELNEISRYALSNLLGGILYSYGKIRIMGMHDSFIQKKELFTASPSRVGFPRGFLWDEGFHQQVICRWNHSLCIRMIQTWLDTIQSDGWIPREQARGEEIESNFKQKEFLYQSDQEANPPSMILPIEYLFYKAMNPNTPDKDKLEILDFLKRYRHNLRNWLEWLALSHVNLDKNEVDPEKQVFFRWKCKQPCFGKYLSSGLDDYPRHHWGYHLVASVDLHSWIMLFVHVVNKIDKFFNDTNPNFVQLEQALPHHFVHMHDYKQFIFRDLVASDYDRKIYLSIHNGYVNIFPLFFGLLLPNSTQFEATLNLAASKEHLWSSFGIRSLSTKDPFFMQGDQYWTEPIWIPMNYLLLRGLKYYYMDNSDARDFYAALRENIIRNMIKTWRETHNFWENYDSFTGEGKGFPSFTGWTTLVILIFSEQY